MVDDLKRAFWISFEHLPLILAVALLFSLFSLTALPGYFLIAAIIAGLALSIVLYGRLVESVLRIERSSWWDLFKSNVLKVIVVGFLLGIPSWIASFMAKTANASTYVTLLLDEGINALVDVGTVYVLPIIFLRGLGPTAIVVGVEFLITRVRESLHLAGLTLAVSAIALPAMFFSGTDLHGMLAAAITLVVSWMQAIIFTGAAIKLTGE